MGNFCAFQFWQHVFKVHSLLIMLTFSVSIIQHVQIIFLDSFLYVSFLLRCHMGLTLQSCFKHYQAAF